MFEIQGSLKFNPFSQIIQFSSSKNINCFFINLKQFQTLPSGFEVDSWNRWPSAYRQISMFPTLHWHDALSQLSKDILKTYHQNLSGAFETASNSKKRFGLVVDKYFKPEHIRISNRRARQLLKYY